MSEKLTFEVAVVVEQQPRDERSRMRSGVRFNRAQSVGKPVDLGVERERKQMLMALWR